MIDREYKVRFITSKNSFLFLSDKDFRKLDQDLLIKLYYGVNKLAYFSLGPSLSFLKEGELALCPVLAKELGIFRGDTVTLSSTKYCSAVRRMRIVTATFDDYEILATLSNDVQTTLLNQVRVVHSEQKLVVWISNSLHVIVNVEGVNPISPGKLENLTTVTVMPPHYTPAPSAESQPRVKKRGSFTSKESILNTYNKSQTLCRMHPIEDLDDALSKTNKPLYFQQPFNIFVSKRVLPHFDETNTTKNITIVNLRMIPLPQEFDSNNESKTIALRLIAIEDLINGFNFNGNIAFCNQFLFELLHAKIGCKVILEPLNNQMEEVKTIEIATTKYFFSKADELVRSYLTELCKNGNVLINANIVLKEINGCNFALKFTPEAAFCLIDSSMMRYSKFSVIEDELVIEDKAKEDEKDVDLNLCLDCCNFENIINEATRCLEMKLLENRSSSSNVLLTGKQGTGKSSVIAHLKQSICKKPHRIHVELIDCKQLKGKNIESLLKVFNGAFSKLIYFQPSLLILDDLHVICEKVVEGEAPSQENIHFNKVSEMLADVFENYLQTNRVSILATGESVMKLNQNVFASRGKHLFRNVFNIDDLNKNDRTEIIKYFFKTKEINCKADFDTLGAKTEGFVIQDLLDLVDKIIFEAYKEDCNVVNDKHCEEALKNASSLSLREVQLHSPGDRDFKDIGGLDDVKKILVECMLWPAQYPNIFGRAPLRLQSGLLLYGPPGTGKTILAGAAAKHCNLRLISIKGPELLSKYIGASEQAVRDVFQKAQSAKPCILFFDEFDSLAPRRGHDNTGVTDRVVNQFLTQLDGVESLIGVCVLAATSRPDLLDPALLRPGRLDRQILCPMPDRDSRLSILKALSKNLPLGKDVNIEKVADDTVGYSGADLQAVLYTAQLTTVEHLLGDNSDKYDSSQINYIMQEHLENAISTTRPSLTRDEKMKYERIYNRFQGKGDLLDLKSAKQKATLA